MSLLQYDMSIHTKDGKAYAKRNFANGMRGVPKALSVMLVGRGGVGKSATVMQLVSSMFVDYDPTIEDSYRKQIAVTESRLPAAFQSEDFRASQSEVVLFEVLDTVAYASYNPYQMERWLRETDSFIFMFDITE